MCATKDASKSTTDVLLVPKVEDSHSLSHTTDDQDDSEDEQLLIDEAPSSQPADEESNTDGDTATASKDDEPPAVENEEVSEKVSADSLIQSEALQKLILESVKKVLSESPVLASLEPAKLASQIDSSAIVRSLASAAAAPKEESAETQKRRLYLRPAGIPDYRPTPIKELLRRKSAENSKKEEDEAEFSAPEEEEEEQMEVDTNATNSGDDDTIKNDNEAKTSVTRDKKETAKSDASTASTSRLSHIMVPAVSQVTRKAWTPGSAKTTKVDEDKSASMIEAVLQVLDGGSSSDTQTYDPTISKANLSKEIESLSNLPQKQSDNVETSADDNKSDAADNSNSKDITNSKCSSDKDIDTVSKSVDGDLSGNEKSDGDAMEKDDNLSDASYDRYSQDRSRSRSSSSSRERRHRRKKRKRDKKKKHSKSKKKRRRYSSSYDSEYEDDIYDEDHQPPTDENDDQATASVKKEDGIDSKEEDGDVSESQSVKNRKRDDSEYSSSKRSRSKSKRRKHSKHRKRSRKKHRKRRYRSSSYDSSGSNSDSNSSDYYRSSRKRRKIETDLSLVKQEEEDVIDLTVIKDESDSDERPPAPKIKTTQAKPTVETERSDTKEKKPTISNVPKEHDDVKPSPVVSTPTVNDVKPKLDGEPTKSRTASTESTNTIPYENDEHISNSSPQPHKNVEPKEEIKSRTTSTESNTIPYENDEQISNSAPQAEPHSSPAPSDHAPHDSPPYMEVKKPSSVFSSKTKTLKEISIFDSLLDGTASSRIKTVKKKCIEELSSSSLTPTLTDEDDVRKKVTKTITSHSSTTSTCHSKSKVAKESSTHVSKSSVRSGSSSHSSSSSSRHSSSSQPSSSKNSRSDSSSSKSHNSSSKTPSSDKNDRKPRTKDDSKSSSSKSSSSKNSKHSSSRSRHSSSSSSKHRSGDEKDKKQSTTSSSGKSKDSSITSKEISGPTPKPAVSSQDSEDFSDRGCFNFNGQFIYYYSIFYFAEFGLIIYPFCMRLIFSYSSLKMYACINLSLF